MVVLSHSFRLLHIDQQQTFAAFDSLVAVVADGVQMLNYIRLHAVPASIVVDDRIACYSYCDTYDSDVDDAMEVVLIMAVAIVSLVPLKYYIVHHMHMDQLRSLHVWDHSNESMAAAVAKIPIQTQRLPEIYQSDDSTLHHRRCSAKILAKHKKKEIN